MKKWPPLRVTATAILLTLNSAIAQKVKLLQHKFFPDYSSASAIAWHKGLLYVMGDDAPSLMVLNKSLKVKKQIPVFDYTTKRIPYREKHDLEAAAMHKNGNSHTLWLFPSFSAANRNNVVVYELKKGAAKPNILRWSLGTTPLLQVNIEGAEFIDGSLLLANRANQQAPTHHLLRYHFDGKKIAEKPSRIYILQLPPTRNVVGLSSLTYVAQKDMLLFTVSTELTGSATSDGAIGDSYLAIVYDAKKKLLESNTIKAETLINLTQAMNNKLPQKIESLAVTRVCRKKMRLFLSADNDDGTTHLFRAALKLDR